MKARDLMSSRCVVVSPDNKVGSAAQLMLDHDLSGLPVVGDDGRLVGIITEGDLLRRAELGGWRNDAAGTASAEERARGYLKSRGWKVGDVMTKDVVTVEEDTSAGRIASLMADYGIKRLPVLKDEKLVGIVSRRDLLKLICRSGPDTTAAGQEALERSIRARLGQDLGLGEDQVRVEIVAGVVHLRGSVGSTAERDAIRTLVESLRGAGPVRLDISIAPSS
jgi:CBS-domain-containing membrane protein